MKKRSLIVVVTLLLVLSAVIIPVNKVQAKSKCYYGQYFELAKDAKKAIKFKGNKVYLKGKWYHTSKMSLDGKQKKYNKKFRLTKKTKYYVEETAIENSKPKKISKKKFKAYVFGDVQAVYFKISYGKVVKAYISRN